MNSNLKGAIVSLSMIVILMVFKGLSGFILAAYVSSASKISFAQRSFGYPNIPEEIAGMATDER